MSGSPTPYANGVVHQRNPFRRQGSSYGPGHVQPMALMVHQPRVDYSVNKGGLKTWAVLLVFALLCSALIAIFSEEHESEYNEEEYVAPAEDLSPTHDAEINEEETIADVQPAPDIDKEEETDDQEASLFAALQEKIQARETEKRVNRKLPPTEPPSEPRHVQRRRQREAERSKAEEKEDEDDDEDDDSEEVLEEQKDIRDRERLIQSDEGDDDDDEDDDSEEVLEEQKIQSTKKPPPPKAPKVKVHVIDKTKDDDLSEEAIDDDSDEDDSEEDDGESEEVDNLVLPRRLRQEPRKKGASWHRSVQAEQMAEDKQNPRKSGLKNRHRKFYPKLTHPLTVDASVEENENEMSNEEESEEAEIHEVATDLRHRERLDQADYLAEKHNFDEAIKLYDMVLAEYKDSPRAQFGIARVKQLRSEFQEFQDDDSLLDHAIKSYQTYYTSLFLFEYTSKGLYFRLAANHLIECARYRGNLHRVMSVQREIIDRFPEDLDAQNDFGITFLMMGRPDDARNVFTTVLEIDPQNAVAQAYYGYLLKAFDYDYERGVQFMRRGLKARDEPIQDAKFYFHLGDGLMRLGRQQEALKVYEEAVELGLFPSVYQRSTYNLDGLVARPWWTLSQTQCARQLKSIERQWTIIREEAQKVWIERPDRFVDEDTHISEGVYRALMLRAEHSFDEKNCQLVPTICRILKDFSEHSRCDKGDMKISVFLPGSRVFPHCAPTNFVLEAHLGLVSPSEARIRCGREVRGWKTGKFLVFDPSFEHEMWFDGAASTAVRIVLSIDLFHPEVPTNIRVDTVY
ncbi:TPR-REGION domain-containing protein [Aphelenchoides besseyi]|nr:TPR-REGION domain-containing protein [Aphelenchoides besseyi]